MEAKIVVTLKDGVLDPQGKAIERSLLRLGFKGISEVRMGKYFEVKLKEGVTPEQAEAQLSSMCDQLFANLTIEKYSFKIEP